MFRPNEQVGSRAHAVQRPLAVALAASALFAVALAAVPAGTTWVSDLGILAMACAAAVLAARRAHAVRSFSRPWWWVAAATATWAFGQGAWAWQQQVAEVTTPFPSWADAAFFGSLILVVVAVHSLPVNDPSVRFSSLLDAGIVAASTLFLTWTFVLAVGTISEPLTTAGLIAVAKPTLYVAVAGGLGLLALRWRGPESAAFVTVGMALGVMAVVSVPYAVELIDGTYVTGGLLDVGWFAAFALVAAATFMPAHEGVYEARPATTWSLVLPYVPAAAVIAVIGGVEVSGADHHDPVLALSGLVLVVLIVARQLQTLFENRALTRDLERRVERRAHQLVERDEQLHLAMSAARISSFSIDLDTDALQWREDPAGILIFPEATTFTQALERVHPDDGPVARAALDSLAHRRSVSYELRILDDDGGYHWLDVHAHGTGIGRQVVGVVSDSTDRHRYEEGLLRLSRSDDLTGLLNRSRFSDEAGRVLAEGPAMLMLVNLDGFKTVNEAFGRVAGDELLVATARRLDDAFGDESIVGRLGGDEFVVLVRGGGEVTDAARSAQMVLDAIRAPHRLAGAEVAISASIGVVLAPMHGDDVELLLARADFALDRAQQRRNTWHVFDEADDRDVGGRLALMGDLRAAVEANALTVEYQPKVDLATDAIVGFEALSRWTHPERGAVPPGVFIPLAEQTGLIDALTDRVLDDALAQCAAWHHDGHQVSVAVNVSPQSLDADLPGKVSRALDRAMVAPRWLTIEITEGALAREDSSVRAAFDGLDELGVKLSVDDFGTGYSSLAYLKRLPVSELKVDRAFVEDLPTDDRDVAIVRAVLALSSTLGMTVVAEGVEEEATRACLAEMGCHQAQGFGLHRPAPPLSFAEILVDQLPVGDRAR